ncbi:MAG: hypothetical protein JWO59_2673 [Chloroflexi bacterium]|nr:hypothetical protein [Chloroflexota bacterium]
MGARNAGRLVTQTTCTMPQVPDKKLCKRAGAKGECKFVRGRRLIESNQSVHAANGVAHVKLRFSTPAGKNPMPISHRVQTGTPQFKC